MQSGALPAPAASRPRHGRAAALLLAPAAVLLIAFLAVPLCATVWASLSPNDIVQFQGPGLDNYAYVFGKQHYLTVIGRTIRLALLATAVALLVGYPTALALWRLPPRLNSLMLMGTTFPILTGPLVVVLGWMVLLSSGGPLLAPLAALGLPVPKILGTETGISVGIVHFVLPLVILMLNSALRAIPPALLEASASLGATPLSRFVHVIWPLSLPGVLSALVVAFALSASSYISPYYLGGAGRHMLGTLVSEFMLATFNGQLAAVAAMLLLIIKTVAIVGATVALGRRMRGP